MMTLNELDNKILDIESLEHFINDSNENNGWYASWSGGYPCLCYGEWTLYHNGEEIGVEIPFQNEPADTYNEYSQWHFGGESGLEEEWDFYEEGYYEENWIENNIEYLKQVTDDEGQYTYIYKAFQENDWRPGSCGGCI
jgi:hypothetical protein